MVMVYQVLYFFFNGPGPSYQDDSRFFATFSILAFDPQTHAFGCAIATNNFAVGASTVYIEPGLVLL